MIPILVADELRETVLDYLDTTFAFRDAAVADALKAFLTDPQEGIFKGPYVHVRLPFRRGDRKDVEPWLDVRPPFTPYLHQIKAFQKLSGKNNRQPDHTLVTTGTGSGKTECFLYPMLDHCARHIGEKGIKALILYPMNALASDQARRIAKEIARDPQLQGLRAGLYVGGKGHSHKGMGPDHVITDRETLRRDPPDILLTNYKMLDYLLMRPDDQTIWKDTGPETLRYLILDELHTYDGAQGSDVACLIRRLKAKLNCKPNSLCFVGTSATLASGSNAQRDLLEFASKLFGEPLKFDSVLTEDRLALAEYLEGDPVIDELPCPTDEMRPKSGDTVQSYVLRQSRIWFGQEEPEAVRLGERLREHVFLRSVLLAFDGKTREWTTLVDRVAKQDPEFATFSPEDREVVLKSFLSLISGAKQIVEGRVESFLQVQVQLWLREMSRLLREVSEDPRFSWHDGAKSEDQAMSLPPVYCRECGYTGWVTRRAANSNQCESEYSRILDSLFKHDRRTTYLFLDSERGSGLTIAPDTLVISDDANGVPICDPDESQQLTQGQPPKDKQWCPVCETDGAMTVVGSQAASLSSVLISHLYTSRFNTDKKLLAFTDSVQDASHRAGFFGARTFRFNLRTAVQTVIESLEGPVSLAELPARVTEYWRSEFIREERQRNANSVEPRDDDSVAYRAAQRFVATFTPPDLQEIAEYKAFVHRNMRKSMKHALYAVQQRLEWEIIMEYGLNARVGRTLDKTLCSTAWFRTDELDASVGEVARGLRERFAPLAGVTDESIRHFVAGLLMRVKLRGGVYHDLLDRYIEEGGRFYWLFKRQKRLMSPFAPSTPRPRFLSLKPGDRDFDSLLTRGGFRNWGSHWLDRSLGLQLDMASANDLYRELLPLLVQHGLLSVYGKGSNICYGISPTKLYVWPSAESLRSKDGDNVVVPPSEIDHWTGKVSLTYRGTGVFDERPENRHHFYRNIYQSGNVERIYCHEHSGLLERKLREEVEAGFKDSILADSPNLLTCTPTLEMGIDVGDLSSTMVCSIPPTPTNYLQRIGRAGRTTGNALILALANVKPHDLYFFEEPCDMIAGDVTPPGCFLDAPEMLKRQFTAFCMDTWCSLDSGGTIPNKVGSMLSGYRTGSFPRPFLDYQAANAEALLKRFLVEFEGQISDEGQNRLRQFALDGLLQNTLEQCLFEVEEELRELRNAIKRLSTHKHKLESQKSTLENADELIREVDAELKVLYRLLQDESDKYPLSLFVERGILPNYDLPEDGVRLKSVVTGVEIPDETGRPTFDTFSKEYTRGASVAIRDFAPLNSFYVESRKLMIDQIDTGGVNRSNIDEWQLCPNCSHLELASLSVVRDSCPKCDSPAFLDVGQKRPLLKLTKVSSRVDNNESKTLDQSDDRDQVQYLLRDYFDIGEDSYGGGYLNEQASFGFEYLRRAVLREVNFGPSDTAIGGLFRTSGEEIRDYGFRVCKDCGVVRPWDSQNEPRHRYWCRFHSQAKPEAFTSVFLFRELESEAIRFLLPLSTMLVEEKATTFKACLELGLRLKFGGRPTHLKTKRQAVPEQAPGGGVRNFLVLYDSVPGGTGYLKEFVRDPAKLLEVFELALIAVKSCSCQRKPGSDGCYRCVYAYQNQREMKLISRTLGIKLLEEVLADWDALVKVDSLAKVRVSESLLESELEERFLAVLSERLGEAGGLIKVVSKGKPCYDLKVSERVWRIEPQVILDSGHGIYPSSRADFVLWPPEESSQVLPIALFTDGYRYHVRPGDVNSRIADDVEKRLAIALSGKFRVFTLTWKDLDPADSDHVTPATEWGVGLSNLKQFAAAKGIGDPSWLFDRPLNQLLTYLASPDETRWQATGDLAASIAASSNPVATGEVERTCRRLGTGLFEEPSPDPTSMTAFVRVWNWEHRRLAMGFELPDKSPVPYFSTWIDDSSDARHRSDFEPAWRAYWATFNVVSRRDRFFPGPSATQLVPNTDSQRPEAGPVPEDAEHLPGGWQEVLALADAEIHSLIQQLVGAGLPLPEVGFELVGEDGYVLADAELAWPQAKVALLLKGQQEGSDEFYRADWSTIEFPGVDMERLVEAVSS
jgi:DEAD/DEAH box helicase domain-containing protein